jgi:Ribbon-helix-helix protein, copG family
MRVKRSELVEFNVYLSLEIYSQLQKLQDAGLSMSAVGRLAVSKCSTMSLDEDDPTSMPKRVQLYLHPEEAETLEQLALYEGDRSKGKILRRMISTYLRVNSTSIEAMF